MRPNARLKHDLFSNYAIDCIYMAFSVAQRKRILIERKKAAKTKPCLLFGCDVLSLIRHRIECVFCSLELTVIKHSMHCEHIGCVKKKTTTIVCVLYNSIEFSKRNLTHGLNTVDHTVRSAINFRT